MAKGKLKLLHLIRIFAQETDDDHALTLQEIAAKLNAVGITADRKTLYSDLEALRQFGFDILSEQREKNTYYHLGAREFELPELKLLVDFVQSAEPITARKSRALIHKLEGLASRYQAAQLHRQVCIAERAKSRNERIYYNVDQLHASISAGVQICFQYGQWNARRELVPRRDGATCRVSPWALTWYNENYYLVAYDAGADRIQHYCVDRMLHICATDEPRLGRETFRAMDMANSPRGAFEVRTGGG